MRGVFALLNEKTAPQGLRGFAATLEDVIDFYVRGGSENPQLDPEIKQLTLTDAEKRNLIAFLGPSLPTYVRHGARKELE